MAVAVLVAVVGAAVPVFAEEGVGEGLRQVTLAVFNFEDSGQSAGVGRAVADMLITKLAKSPVLRVYERGRLEEVLSEQQRVGGWNRGGGDPKLRAAATLGVQFVLMGKVSEFGVSENSVLIPLKGTVTKYKARAALDVRLVRVSDAQVLKTWVTAGAKSDFNLGVNVLGIPNFSFSGKEFDDSLLGRATREAVDDAAEKIEGEFSGEELQELARRLPVEGRVADVEGVEGGGLVLNVGRMGGVEAGMALDIYRLEKEIKDPETGEMLTERLEYVGEALVTRVEENFSEAEVLSVEAGYKVRVNDRVKEQLGNAEEEEGGVLEETGEEGEGN